ncbi:hypothetical protein ACFYYS_26900 [Streptomyces sp. NPDC002120]
MHYAEIQGNGYESLDEGQRVSSSSGRDEGAAGHAGARSPVLQP